MLNTQICHFIFFVLHFNFFFLNLLSRLALNRDPPIPASWVARITGLSHQFQQISSLFTMQSMKGNSQGIRRKNKQKKRKKKHKLIILAHTCNFPPWLKFRPGTEPSGRGHPHATPSSWAGFVTPTCILLQQPCCFTVVSLQQEWLCNVIKRAFALLALCAWPSEADSFIASALINCLHISETSLKSPILCDGLGLAAPRSPVRETGFVYISEVSVMYSKTSRVKTDSFEFN
jgi:hypothetical protein